MRFDELFIAGVGSYLPKTVDVDEAVADGRYDAEEQAGSGQLAVAVAGDGETQPEMAALAGRVALERSGRRPDEVALLLHAVTGHNGLEGWNSAAYLQKRVLGGAGISFEIRQLSNGAIASVELAGAYLAASGLDAAIITSADRFAEPAWDRWRSSWGLVFADGASAAVLSRDGGFARVLSAVTVSDPDLEVLHRGSLPFTAAPDTGGYPIDFRARTLDSSYDIGFDEVSARMATGLKSAVARATEEAGVSVADARHCVVPHFGRELLHRECLGVLGIDLARTTWSWAAHIGHLGAADQFAGLTYLTEAGALAPGDRVLLLGIGGGFNWTCVVLEITGHPSWS
ncbi:3-oxoacyl-[acyl-carrier-protein] synthase-3 [Amycolatopsis xylanica]|uniref:3-oxoacyl-[acyl-carrier-protein] synthase-3 n=1 Tax=Amycolatopsis xylanica TaxID=589385 RepID=A0A1H2VTM6_9PSEU|nr:ketoacyl-ACP synthase III family protein [Amycolatopsis xylanica]SDW71703.1 3-oxoacyl-[acyl-carrier-protein] synthase-3 [Amycolatopsis xylanica]